MSRIITPGHPDFHIHKRNYVESFGETKNTVEGVFTLRAIKPGKGVVRERTFHNLITNIGLDSLGGTPQWLYMHLGTGTNTPTNTDTQLGNFGVNVSNGGPYTQEVGAASSAPYFSWRRLWWKSEIGEATGVWTEVGISQQYTNGDLMSRALILDNSSNPTSFPVLADEQFEGSYEFRMYPSVTDAPAEITLGSNTYDTVTRPLYVNSAINHWGCNIANWSPWDFWIPSGGSSHSVSCAAYTGDLNAVTDYAPQGDVLDGGTSVGCDNYSTASYERTSWCRAGSDQWVGDIKTIAMRGSNFAYQISYDPVIEKLAVEEIIHRQKFSWARR